MPNNVEVNRENDINGTNGDENCNSPTMEEDEIVISGISGTYPDSRNVEEFKNNLYNKVDMVNDDERRWKHFHPDIQKRAGKIFDIEKFDAGYFGMHYNHVNYTEPICRIALEKTIEALFDAGINPSELEGSDTGVFLATSFYESQYYWHRQTLQEGAASILNMNKSVTANRVSYFLKLNGPSYCLDTACSSSLIAIENAVQAIKMGNCKKAIVLTGNICIQPFVTLQFDRLGVLSKEGKCKVFDQSADGYVRSESIGALILEKGCECRRKYATIIHIKTNSDGYKPENITHPSSEMQGILMKAVYDECKIDPSDLSYLEAHGTATKIGDPEECKAIADMFLKNRRKPLLIGSVKSNMGHSEPSSGFNSLTKCIISMENNLICPNLHYNETKGAIENISQGMLKVVSEPTPFQDNNGLVAINNFGFGGANCHLLMRWNTNYKNINGNVPELSRLVCVSGRTKNGVDILLNGTTVENFDPEKIGLLHEIFSKPVQNHIYRGFAIGNVHGEFCRSIKYFKEANKPLYISFGCFSEHWQKMGQELLELPAFKETFLKINKILNKNDKNIIDLLKIKEITIGDGILGDLLIQISIADVLKSLMLKPTHILGDSLGELACAYFDNCLTLSESVNISFALADTFGTNIGRFKVKENKSKETFFELKTKISKFIQNPKQWSTMYLTKNFTKSLTAESLINSMISLTSIKEHLKKNTNRATIFKIGTGQINGIFKDIRGHDVISMEALANTNGLKLFLQNIGELYELGYYPQIKNLYPKIKFPVSRGTPMIAPHIKWDHFHDWNVIKYELSDSLERNQGHKRFRINIMDEWAFVTGHIIDGRNLFPAAGYLVLVWETFSLLTETIVISSTPVSFENVKFKRSCNVPATGWLDLEVSIQKGEGCFEVLEGGQVIVTGKISKGLSGNVNLDDKQENSEIILSQEDIYKELRLRGYNYKGLFTGMTQLNQTATHGKIKWENNWTAFIDIMLQTKILGIDTRLLYVPTGIQYLSINPLVHEKYRNEENVEIPVNVISESNLIICGGVQMRKLEAASIQKRKELSKPIIETYEFMPNIAQMTLDQSLRVNIQLILEEFPTFTFKTVEIVDEATKYVSNIMALPLEKVFLGQPLVQPSITVLSKNKISNLPNSISVEDKPLSSELDCHLITGTNLFSRPHILQLCLNALKENGFILSIENSENLILNNMEVLTLHKISDGQILTLARPKLNPKTYATFNFKNKDQDYSWVEKLQKVLKEHKNIIIYAQNDDNSGILGFVNCLRRESAEKDIRCFFIKDFNAPKFDQEIYFYQKQLKKNMFMNVYQNGVWGTYRHLLLENIEIMPYHSFSNNIKRGDLSTFSWLEGPILKQEPVEPNTKIFYVNYAALNFKDVMLASGKISSPLDPKTECNIGFEFSGKTNEGKRVMGMVKNNGLSNIVETLENLLWIVPEKWTLEQAATVPCVYGTALHAIDEVGKIQKGESILIHSGTGGVGQAAIYLAFHFGCQVFTTVGTEEKRQYLLQKFPQINASHIGNSRDTSFEQMVMKETKGKGVNLVLNSLSDEKLMASVRCLAPGGRFLEIGKYDLMQNTDLKMLLLEQNRSFHGIMIDAVMDGDNLVLMEFNKKLQQIINCGAVVPLETTVFKTDEIETAFRYMTKGQHTGKVLIKIHDEDTSHLTFKSWPRYYCDSDKVYIVIGGLGGFGLELTNWLIQRGARKVVLSSRSGVKSGYQAYRIRTWKSLGTKILVSKADVTNINGCTELIEVAKTLGEIESIFNLAVSLKDSFFENQNIYKFEESFKPKSVATKNLDQITRNLCPNLKDFVVFSSVSCGRGNAGQTNYGMTNSIMERICEKRKQDGYPGLAIQWGAIGEVGLVAEMQKDQEDIEIGGTIPQKIISCMQCLDIFLKQKSPVVSSIVVAEKRSGFGDSKNIVDVVANILGLKDLKSVSLHATLAEIGMDSMTAVEVKQTLEREFDIFLTPQDVRLTTLHKLQSLQEEGNENNTAPSTDKNLNEEQIANMDTWLNLIETEVEDSTPIVRLPSMLSEKENGINVIIFPGIDGVAKAMECMSQNLEAHVFGIQYSFEVDTVLGYAQESVKHIRVYLEQTQKFHIVGHSFGGIIAMETVKILEQEGYFGNLYLVDSAPEQVKYLLRNFNTDSAAKLETMVVCQMMSMYVSQDEIEKVKDSLLKLNTFNDRLNVAQEMIKKTSKLSENYQRKMCIQTYNRIKAMLNYVNTPLELKSEVFLFKPSINGVQGLNEDYGLDDIVNKNVPVTVIEGNHFTLLKNASLIEQLNKHLK